MMRAVSIQGEDTNERGRELTCIGGGISDDTECLDLGVGSETSRFDKVEVVVENAAVSSRKSPSCCSKLG